MPSAARPSEEKAAMAPAARAAVDELWHYQLRREHSALLKRIDIVTEQFSTQNSETDRKFKAMQKSLEEDRKSFRAIQHRLDVRIEQLSKSLEAAKERTQVGYKIINDHLSDGGVLKRKVGEMGGMLDNRTEADLRSLFASTKSPSTANSPVHNPELQGVTSKFHDQNFQQLVASTTSTLGDNTATNNTSATTAIPATSSGPASAPAPRSQNMANSGVRKNPRRLQTSPTAPPPHQYSKLPDPALEQKRKSLASYVKQTHLVYTTLAPSDYKTLAGMFISGMQSAEDQQRLVDKLEELNMVEWTGEDQIVMKCKWLDICSVLEMLGIGGLGRPSTPVRNTRSKRVAL